MLRPSVRLPIARNYPLSRCGQGLFVASAGALILLIGATVGAQTAAPVASAQPSSDSGALAEVVVTSNKLNAQRVLDTPASIQVISGDTLRSASSSAFMDIADDLPGLAVQDLGPGDKKYVIRGINSMGDSSAGIYCGGAVISGSNADDGGGFQSDIQLYDLDRVKVLRGPQGTLYGASATSGRVGRVA